jgi:hypothetical protein
MKLHRTGMPKTKVALTLDVDLVERVDELGPLPSAGC